MFHLIRIVFTSTLRLFRTRRSLLLENLVLRQQLVVLKRKRTRPRLGIFDKFFWVFLRRFWSEWKRGLIVVDPETVVRWHDRRRILQVNVTRHPTSMWIIQHLR